MRLMPAGQAMLWALALHGPVGARSLQRLRQSSAPQDAAAEPLACRPPSGWSSRGQSAERTSTCPCPSSASTWRWATCGTARTAACAPELWAGRGPTLLRPCAHSRLSHSCASGPGLLPIRPRVSPCTAGGAGRHGYKVTGLQSHVLPWDSPNKLVCPQWCSSAGGSSSPASSGWPPSGSALQVRPATPGSTANLARSTSASVRVCGHQAGRELLGRAVHPAHQGMRTHAGGAACRSSSSSSSSSNLCSQGAALMPGACTQAPSRPSGGSTSCLQR